MQSSIPNLHHALSIVQRADDISPAIKELCTNVVATIALFTEAYSDEDICKVRGETPSKHADNSTEMNQQPNDYANDEFDETEDESSDENYAL